MFDVEELLFRQFLLRPHLYKSKLLHDTAPLHIPHQDDTLVQRHRDVCCVWPQAVVVDKDCLQVVQLLTKLFEESTEKSLFINTKEVIYASLTSNLSQMQEVKNRVHFTISLNIQANCLAV